VGPQGIPSRVTRGNIREAEIAASILLEGGLWPEGCSPVPLVTPATVHPAEVLRRAVAANYRVFERGNRRSAHLHIWAWTSQEIQQAVQEGISRANAADVDGTFLTCATGGVEPGRSIYRFSCGRCRCWRKLTATALCRALTRSYASRRRCWSTVGLAAAEALVYAIRKHQLARLVGEREAGLTQAQLAALIGVKQPMTARVERGPDPRTPRWDVLRRVGLVRGKQFVL